MKDFKKIIPYLIVLIISCNKKSEIHINISTTTEINKEMNTIDSTYLLNSDYFEIELQSYKNGEYFKAEKDLIKPQPFEIFKLVTLRIIDKNGNSIEFKNSTDFLNFMSSNGYEMQEKINHINTTEHKHMKIAQFAAI